MRFILERKYLGDIYHFTSHVRLEKILEENILIATSGNTFKDEPSYKHINFEEKRYVSFTRNKHFNRLSPHIHSTEIRLTLDAEKLSDRYKITPINYFIDSEKGYKPKTESEEAIFTNDGIFNIVDYIKEISINKGYFSKFGSEYFNRREFEHIDKFEYDELKDEYKKILRSRLPKNSDILITEFK